MDQPPVPELWVWHYANPEDKHTWKMRVPGGWVLRSQLSNQCGQSVHQGFIPDLTVGRRD